MEQVIMEQLYKLNSNPLITETPVVGGLYCTKEGDKVHVLRYIEDELLEYDVVQRSELNDGELVTNLDSCLLKLFWKLMGYNSERTIRYEEHTD